MDWEDIKGQWTAGWNYMWSEAQGTWKSLVEKNPEHYRPKVEAFMKELQLARAHLDKLKASLPFPPVTPEDVARAEKYKGFEKRYKDIAAGLYSESMPAKGPAMGFIPLLVVAGLALSAAAVAWSIPGYQYAANLREQTELAARELDARVTASKEGRTLQKSTLPPPAPPPSLLPTAGGIGTWIVLGLAAVAGVVFVPKLMKAKL